jgi:nitrogen fixation protein
MQTETYNYDGVITRVSDEAGVAYIFAKDLNEQFIFSYNKIAGYSGESAKEMHLKPGRQVSFSLRNGVVQLVELL